MSKKLVCHKVQQPRDRLRQVDLDATFADFFANVEGRTRAIHVIAYQRPDEKSRARRKPRPKRGAKVATVLALVTAICLVILTTTLPDGRPWHGDSNVNRRGLAARRVFDSGPAETSSLLPVGTTADNSTGAGWAIDVSVCSPVGDMVTMCGLKRQLRQDWLDRHDRRLYRGRLRRPHGSPVA